MSKLRIEIETRTGITLEKFQGVKAILDSQHKLGLAPHCGWEKVADEIERLISYGHDVFPLSAERIAVLILHNLKGNKRGRPAIPEEAKNVRITITLPPDVHSAVLVEMKRSGLSKSATIAKMLRECKND
jgi:hypothetical protein